jgi:hypothetical protein
VSLFLVAYLAFFLKRYIVRQGVKEAIAKRRFDSRTLPDNLQYSLHREDLLRIQFKGEVLARHEKGASHRAPPELVIQTNLGRPMLGLVGIFIVLPAFLALLWVGGQEWPPGHGKPSGKVGTSEFELCIGSLPGYDDSQFDSRFGPDTTSSGGVDSPASIDSDIDAAPIRSRRLPGNEEACRKLRNDRPLVLPFLNPDNLGGTDLGWLFACLAFFNLWALLITSRRFFSLLFRHNLVLYADGIGPGGAKCGLIPWENVEAVVWNEGSPIVGLNIHDQKEPVNIDLEFYNINPKHFVELVQENLSRTAHPVLAQLRSPS